MFSGAVAFCLKDTINNDDAHSFISSLCDICRNIKFYVPIISLFVYDCDPALLLWWSLFLDAIGSLMTMQSPIAVLECRFKLCASLFFYPKTKIILKHLFSNIALGDVHRDLRVLRFSSLISFLRL